MSNEKGKADSNIMDQHGYAIRVFGEPVEKMKIQMDESFLSSEDFEIARAKYREKVDNVLLADSMDYNLFIQKMVGDSLDNLISNIEAPRYLDYHDIEYFLDIIRAHLISKGIKFQDFICLDGDGNKDNFEKYFKRQIIRKVLRFYISDFIPDEEIKINTDSEHQQKLGNLRKKLHNILNEPILEELLILLTDIGWIELDDDNISDKLTKEIEQKIHNINKEDLIAKLEKAEGFKKIFEGYVTDTYYDFKDGRLSGKEVTIGGKTAKLKRSFRIRVKEQKETREKTYYYTVKREDKDAAKLHDYRDCWEEELRILKDKYHIIESIIIGLGLYQSKHKWKERCSYVHEQDNVQVDVEDYKGIKNFAEIEGEKRKKIEKHKKKLGIDDPEINPTSAKGASATHRKLGVPYNTYVYKNGSEIEEDDD